MDTLRRLQNNIYGIMKQDNIQADGTGYTNVCGTSVSARKCISLRPLAIVRMPYGSGGCSCEAISIDEIIEMFNQNK